MLPILAIAGGAVLLLAMTGKRSGRSGRPSDAETPRSVCSMNAATVSTELQRSRMTLQGAYGWLECDGRTPQEAAELARRLRASGRTGARFATAIESRWNAIREVVSSPPDGRVESPQARDTIARVESGEDPGIPGILNVDGDPAESAPPSGGGTMRMGEPTLMRTADARRLVAPVIRALRRRSNYRAPLTEFQRAAGITADGVYGGQSYNALRYYGGEPPAPFRGPAPTSPEAAYPPGIA